MFYIHNFNLNTISPSLEHLNKEQIVQLVNEYYDGIKVNELIEKYELDIIASKLVSVFPLIKINIKCEFCNVHLIT